MNARSGGSGSVCNARRSRRYPVAISVLGRCPAGTDRYRFNSYPHRSRILEYPSLRRLDR
ncbi:hypothetical protein FTUN_6736 [Frigoriglobus tundricola]|uniref:Uncharacterized protein n=1 Tax=Frigoriglobus tundricola TaxID=2774151 RepID=A0A6M5Z092_9BACT|nr:hypothetical protein FTUN_6736 [Frigoriglobus tundricola]